MRIKSFSAKILSAILAVALLVSSVFVGGVSFASAEETGVATTSYFTVGGSAYSATYIDNNLRFAPVDKAEEKDGKWVAEGQFKNKIAINDFEMEFKLLEGVSAVEFTFETDSYIKTGNKVVDGEKTTYETTVKNVVRVTEDGTLALSVDNQGVLSYSLNGATAVALSQKVECNDKTMAIVSVKVEYTDTEKPTAGGVDFVYIDQSVSDNIDHKLEFALNGSSLSDTVEYIIDLNTETTGVQSFYMDGKTAVALYKDTEYTIKYNAYKLNAGGTPVAKLIAVDQAAKDACSLNESEKKVVFTKVCDVEDRGVYVEQIPYNLALVIGENQAISNIEVYVFESEQIFKDDYATDEAYKTALEIKAPKYSENEMALESFKAKLEDATKAEYEVNGQKVTASIRVGSSKYLDIPSMESFVDDNIMPYSKLTKTVYYMNVDTDTKFSTYSGMKVPVKTAGTYVFFVIFEDMFGNKLSTDNFYTEEDGVITLTSDANFAPYIFTFELEDDAPMSVKGGNQSTWYKGVKNTAASFTIEASDDRTVAYKLEYKNGNEWVEIKQYTDDAAEYGFFSAEDTKNMAYDGTLTFTPVKTGTYRFTCTVTLKNFSGTAEATSEIIVNDVTTVKPDDHFFENNIGSFIFLGIGTLALAGVIVLLCIKPKEEN